MKAFFLGNALDIGPLNGAWEGLQECRIQWINKEIETNFAN